MESKVDRSVVDARRKERSQKRLEKKRKRRQKKEENSNAGWLKCVLSLINTNGSIPALKTLPGKGGTLCPGVVYVGHIPHGFYEEEMRKYFSQFGTVTRLRLARSKKSGRSKGYAFIEFECDEVAKVVAETMNNYLMFNKLLKCQFVGVGRVRRSGRRAWEIPLHQRQQWTQKRHNTGRTMAEHCRRVSRLLSRDRQKRARLKELGIDYQFPGYVACTQPHKTATHTIFTHNSDTE